MQCKYFKQSKSKVRYPAIAQRKLNGIRATVTRDDTGITVETKSGNIIQTVAHLDIDLMAMLEPGDQIDGEIYKHEMTLNEIASLVSKIIFNSSEQKCDYISRRETLQFHCFDLCKLETPFILRYQILSKKINETDKIKIVQNFKLFSENDVYFFDETFVNAGYEGVVIRNIDGLYLPGKRSNDCQKYKDFLDNEYTIIGYKQAVGKDAGTVIFRCKTTDNQSFYVRMKGNLNYRKSISKIAYDLIGKNMTVRHYGFSQSGIPMYPTGIVIRDYE